MNGWVLLVAAVVTCPAFLRLAQGLVSVEEVLVRYLVVAVGVAVVTSGLRRVWPAPPPGADTAAAAAEPAAAAESGEPAEQPTP